MPSQELIQDILVATSFRRRDGKYKVLGDEMHPRLYGKSGYYGVSFRFPLLEESKKKPSVSGLGALDVLPPELIHTVLDHFSAREMLTFRHVSRHAREFVDKSRGFRTVTQDASYTLKAIIKTRLADKITFSTIYDAMLQPTCVKCPDAGQYLYLPTMKRCCLNCLHQQPYFRVVKLTEFAKAQGFSPSRLGKLVRVVSPEPRCEGGYADGRVSCTRRTNYVRYQSAKAEVERITGTIITDTEPLSYQPYVVTTPLPVWDNVWKEWSRAFSCKGCGNKCDVSNEVKATYREYTVEGMLEHFKVCEEAQYFWRRSKFGKELVYHMDSEFVDRGGMTWR